MYTLHSARFRRDRRAGRWDTGDLSAVPVKTLQTTHGDVWLFISVPGIEAPQALRFDDVAVWVADVSPTMTVSEWLVSLGNRSLPFASQHPGFDSHYVSYHNAWHSGFDINPIHRTGTLPQGGSLVAKTDLHLTREGVDPQWLGPRALFTVNGFFHLADYGPDGIYIRDGNTTVMRANTNHVGIHSFAEVGTLKCVPITPAMLSRQRDDLPYRQGVYVTVPPTVDVTNKTVLLVIGGYLQVLDKTYTRVGDRTWRVELGHLQLVKRYYDSYHALDLSSLGLTLYDDRGGLLSVQEIQADATIEAYLTLSQSFLVVVDTPSMFQEWEPIQSLDLPGRYVDRQRQPFPVIGSYGRVLEYHIKEEEGQYVYITTPNLRQDYEFQHRPWRQSTALIPSVTPTRPVGQSQAYYRKLGTER